MNLIKNPAKKYRRFRRTNNMYFETINQDKNVGYMY